MRKEHGHAYYCAKQKSLTSDFIIKYRDNASAIQPDDKSSMEVGEEGTAASVLRKQRSSMSTMNPAVSRRGSGQELITTNLRAIDHDAGSVKMRIIPTVHLVPDIPKRRDESWCRGQVFVTLKNSVFESSEANMALAEIEKSLRRMNKLTSLVWEHADGGGEHHTEHPSVIVATVNFWLRNYDKVDRFIKTRGCPYHSYMHEVEKVMSILNLALYNVSTERPSINQEMAPGMEARFRLCKNITELRSYGGRFPQLVSGLNQAMLPLYEMFYERFERLQLKEQPFLRGEKVTTGEADAFFDTIKPLLAPSEQNLKRGDIKRKHLASEKLKRLLDTHCTRDAYKIELDKTCWRSQLRALRIAHDGELPAEKVAELFSTFKCEFGCPPPTMPVDEFIDMHPVPRPKSSAGGKYLSFEETYGTSTPLDLPPINIDKVVELAPQGVLTKEKAQGTIRCTRCSKLRCVYVKNMLDRMKALPTNAQSALTLEDMMVDMIDANAMYSCGADLDLTGYDMLTGNSRPYVRLKLDCSSHMELQLYTSSVLSSAEADAICGFCGEDGRRVQPDTEAAPLLPICSRCEMQHKEGRGMRGATRFDRGEQRIAQQRAAKHRAAAAHAVAAHGTAAPAATAAPITTTAPGAAAHGNIAPAATMAPAAGVCATSMAPTIALGATSPFAATTNQPTIPPVNWESFTFSPAAVATHENTNSSPAFHFANAGCTGTCCPSTALAAPIAASNATPPTTTMGSTEPVMVEDMAMQDASSDVIHDREGSVQAPADEAQVGGFDQQISEQVGDEGCGRADTDAEGGGDLDEEGVELMRHCELCNHDFPALQVPRISRDHAGHAMNGYGCANSEACKLRCQPAPRARSLMNFRDLVAGRS